MRTTTPLLRLAYLVLLSALAPVSGQAAEPAASAEAGHRALAEHIFQRMRLSDSEASARLIEATVAYRVTLERILTQRQDTLDAIRAAGWQGEQRDAAIVEAYEVAKAAFLPLKRDYVRTLEFDLVPYHVERVKDGLTQDALPRLHAMYLEMVPDLKPAERAHILGLLVEARENAMLAVDAHGQKQ